MQLFYDFQYGVADSCLWGEEGSVDSNRLPADVAERMRFLCGAFQESLDMDTAEYRWSAQDWREFKAATDELLTVLREEFAGQCEIVDARFFNDMV
jgi:hypothetical protein